MYPMQDSSAEDESGTYRLQQQAKDPIEQMVTWLWRLWFAAWIIAILFAVWQQDSTRLYILHNTTRSLQSIAKAVGYCAIASEQAYNDIVKTLH